MLEFFKFTDPNEGGETRNFYAPLTKEQEARVPATIVVGRSFGRRLQHMRQAPQREDLDLSLNDFRSRHVGIRIRHGTRSEASSRPQTSISQVPLTRRHLSHLPTGVSAYEVGDAPIDEATILRRVHSTNEWRKALVRTADAALYEASGPAATGRISADGPALAQGVRDLVLDIDSTTAQIHARRQT
jgi:hypothetical protein